MGITTPLSTNPAMTIGGLTVGVTPLDMAHAYETIAHGGERVSGSLAEGDAPVGIQEVKAGTQPLPDGSRADKNKVISKRVLPAAVAETETSMLETVLQYGTGKAAAIGQFAAGKTGTTSNYGDAWFVGWDSKYTVAVWVGYPNKLIPMTTDFNGGPVLGGTFPALIWHDFMISALRNRQGTRGTRRASKKGATSSSGETSSTATPEASASGDRAAPSSNDRDPAPRRAPRQGPAPPLAGTQANRSATAPEHARRHPPTPPRGRHRRPRRPRRRHRRADRRRRAADWRRRRVGSACTGRGRETLRLPATQKRQGSSTARLIPMRVPATIGGSAHSGERAPIRTGPLDRLPPFSASVIPSACVSLPGPEQRSSTARRRAARHGARASARSPRSARARGSAPPRRRPRARTPRSAARGCRRSGRRRRARARRTACACAA